MTEKCSKVAVCLIVSRVPFGVRGVAGGDAVTVVVTVTGADGVPIGETTVVVTVAEGAFAEEALDEAVPAVARGTPDA